MLMLRPKIHKHTPQTSLWTTMHKSNNAQARTNTLHQLPPSSNIMVTVTHVSLSEGADSVAAALCSVHL